MLGALTVASCTATATPLPTGGTATAAAPAPSSNPTEPPSAPVLLSEGTADDNLPLFSEVVTAVWAGPENVSGRAYIDALVVAGFDKTTMQLSPDQTTIGNPAETVQFSVRWAGQCLVGQVGPSTGTPVTMVQPLIGADTCLVGNTRSIDW